MKANLKRQFATLLFVLLAAGFLPGLMNTAQACPSCKAANETDARRPRAYMYSILFMLAMPATVFTGFGVSFYRLSRQAQQMAEAGGNADTDSADKAGENLTPIVKPDELTGN